MPHMGFVAKGGTGCRRLGSQFAAAEREERAGYGEQDKGGGFRDERCSCRIAAPLEIISPVTDPGSKSHAETVGGGDGCAGERSAINGDAATAAAGEAIDGEGGVAVG